jgi:hypothetical protein
MAISRGDRDNRRSITVVAGVSLRSDNARRRLATGRVRPLADHGLPLQKKDHCGAPVVADETFQVAIRGTEITRPPRSRRQARGKVVRSAARPSPRRNFAPSRAPSVFPTTRDREKSPAHA